MNKQSKSKARRPRVLKCEQRRFNLALQDRQKMDRMLQELKCKMTSTEIKYTLIASEMKQLCHLQCKLNKTVEQYNVEIRKETELLTAVVRSFMYFNLVCVSNSPLYCRECCGL